MGRKPQESSADDLPKLTEECVSVVEAFISEDRGMREVLSTFFELSALDEARFPLTECLLEADNEEPFKTITERLIEGGSSLVTSEKVMESLRARLNRIDEALGSSDT